MVITAALELERVLETKSGEVAAIAEAAATGQHEKVIDGIAGLIATLATGNPLVGALAPFARRGVARAFGNAVDDMLRRELAEMRQEEDSCGSSCRELKLL